jgi:hypothetical protein
VSVEQRDVIEGSIVLVIVAAVIVMLWLLSGASHALP